MWWFCGCYFYWNTNKRIACQYALRKVCVCTQGANYGMINLVTFSQRLIRMAFDWIAHIYGWRSVIPKKKNKFSAQNVHLMKIQSQFWVITALKYWSSSLKQFNPLDNTSELHMRTLIHHLCMLFTSKHFVFSIFNQSASLAMNKANTF